MKNVVMKYRGIVVCVIAMIINITAIIIFYNIGDFTEAPLYAKLVEMILEMISLIGLIWGMMMAYYDCNKDQKEKIKEAILESADEVAKRSNGEMELKMEKPEGEMNE